MRKIMATNPRDRKSKIGKRSIIVNTILLCVVNFCLLESITSKNKIDPVEIEQRILTEEHGEMAFNILENYTAGWMSKEVKITGVRVLSYTENSQLKIIGCTEETFDIEYPNSTSHIEDHFFRRIYVFEFTDGSWEIQIGFTLDSYEDAVHDWWYFNEEGKAIIEELPDFKYWECLYPPNE